MMEPRRLGHVGFTPFPIINEQPGRVSCLAPQLGLASSSCPRSGRSRAVLEGDRAFSQTFASYLDLEQPKDGPVTM